MPAAVRAFFRRHPVLRDVLLWSIPALLVGGFLRALILSYLPYAYWGSDSKSYFSFAHMLLTEGYVSLDEKRRYLYPIFMVPVTLLPGSPLKTLAWVQHFAGLITILPLAYVVRKTMRFWKWWIVPVTVAYVGLPILLWYEHELLGETVFFMALAWAFGGWVAWTTSSDSARARRLFWWFFVPLAVFLLTKPSGRFVLPGIVVGLVMVRAWRVFGRAQWIALTALILATLTVGSKKQAAWLLYVATFPLTQFDTPKHAEYKAEIRAYAQPYVDGIDAYYLADKRGLGDAVGPFYFLESPSEEKAPPLWAALDKDSNKKRQVYMDLAMEGIRAEPLKFLYLGYQRIVASANLSEFGDDRFTSGYYAPKLESLYVDAGKTLAKGKPSSLPMAFGLPRGEPLPAYAEFTPRLSPHPGGWAEQTVLAWVRGVHAISDVVKFPPFHEDAPPAEVSVKRAWLTPLGWYLLAAIGLALAYWRTLGVWAIIGIGYIVLMFLVSHMHTRYFAPVWVLLLPLLAVPLDLILRAFIRRRV